MGLFRFAGSPAAARGGMCLSGALAIALSSGIALGGGSLPLPTTPNDFVLNGSQPGSLIQNIASNSECFQCHNGTDQAATTVKPFKWRGSAHAHAGRDPIWDAARAIAEQDAPGSGETCIRCHVPKAWIEGRSTPSDGSALTFEDIDDGVGCNTCHRMVDPYYTPENPMDDQAILAGVTPPVNHGNAQYILDPIDVRRGPFDDPAAPHLWLHSPHHQTSDLCATCHDVTNPAISRIGGATPSASDTYEYNAADTPHPTQDKYDGFPEQRTYSEWLNSAFAQGSGVPLYNPADPYDLNGRFGGNLADQSMHPNGAVQSCQDCHMQDVTGTGCIDNFGPPVRDDLPDHLFRGANVFLLDLVEYLYSEDFDRFTGNMITRAKGEIEDMVAAATDLELSIQDCELNVRIINQCGHKLLTGYPEGRRIWINVKWFDDQDVELVSEENGAYDLITADLDTSTTKVYETKMGLDSYASGETGLPAGESFHLVLNNTILKDNRIPPRGFTNAAFEAVQAQPVNYSYADGQYWDDTRFTIPAGAETAEVTVYYQTASKEYIEFLEGDPPTPAGTTLVNAWAAVGKSLPMVMDLGVIDLTTLSPDGDANGDGSVDVNDITHVIFRLGGTGLPGTVDGDADGNGSVDVADVSYVIFRLGAVCS